MLFVDIIWEIFILNVAFMLQILLCHKNSMDEESHKMNRNTVNVVESK